MASSGASAPLEGGDELPFEELAVYDTVLKTTNYDTLAVAASFLEQCASGVALMDHWRTWKPDHHVIMETYKGTNCAGLSLKLQEAGVGGELFLSTKYNRSHIALGRRFNNPKHVDDKGIILMDLGLHFSKPVTVRVASVSTLFLSERAHLIGYGMDNHQDLKACSLGWPWQVANLNSTSGPLVASEATVISDITYKRIKNKTPDINKTPRFFFVGEPATAEKIEGVGKSTIPYLSCSVVNRADHRLSYLTYNVRSNKITVDIPNMMIKEEIQVSESGLTADQVELIGFFSEALRAPALLSALQVVLGRRNDLIQFVEDLIGQGPSGQ